MGKIDEVRRWASQLFVGTVLRARSEGGRAKGDQRTGGGSWWDAAGQRRVAVLGTPKATASVSVRAEARQPSTRASRQGDPALGRRDPRGVGALRSKPSKRLVCP